MNEIIQLKITLKGTSSPIYREIQVESVISFLELHHIIQITMGWQNYHLFEFIFEGYRIGIPDEEFDSDSEVLDATDVNIDKILTEQNSRFTYIYDFGDSWEHEIEVVKYLKKDKVQTYPVCIDGKRACPPEDCGGTWGYTDLLKKLNKPKHPEHKEIKKWLGKKFSPEIFDIEAVNKQLSKLKSYIKKWNN